MGARMRRTVGVFVGLALLCTGAQAAPGLAADVPFTLVDNRVFVPVTLDGYGPFQMLLDTGADTGGISLNTAKAIGAPSLRSLRIGGAGEGTDAATTTRIDSLVIGGARFSRLPMLAEDFSALNDVIGFRHFDGIVGQALFRRYVVDLDFAAQRLRLIEPAAFTPPKGAIVVPFTFYQGFMPLVRGQVAGARGRFIVDLGDRSSLTLFGPFWRAHHLDDALQPNVEALTGYGIGGPIKGLVVRVPRFDFGKAQALQIVARLSLQASGGFADPKIAGSIGTGVLRHFHTVIDYPHKRFLLVPRAPEADRYDRAGMWLGRHGAQFAVFDVVKGGPADIAGLRVGDVVTQIDRRRTESLDLFRIRAQFADPRVDDPMLIDYVRAGRPRQTTLRLRALLPGG
jgi:hypothetical protein